jgi:hypothetical protein
VWVPLGVKKGGGRGASPFRCHGTVAVSRRAVTVDVTKEKGDTVLDCLMEADSVPSEQQHLLFTMFNQCRDWDQLARLCAIKDIDPDVDAKLAKVSSAKVKAAWMSRPGRTTEQMAAAVRGERRISVLEAMAASTAEPDLLLTMLNAGRSLRVAIAALNNENASEAAQAAAGKVIGEQLRDGSSRNQRRDALNAVSSHPAALAAVGSATSDPELLAMASELETMTPRLAAHIVEAGITAPLAALRDHIGSGAIGQADWNYSYRIQSRWTPIMTVISAVASSVWLDDATADAILAALHATEEVIGQNKKTDYVTQAITAIEARAASVGLLAAARSGTQAEVEAAMARSANMPYANSLSQMLHIEVSARTDLPLATRQRAISRVSTWSIIGAPQQYPMPLVVFTIVSQSYYVHGQQLVTAIRDSGHVGWEDELRNLLKQARAEKVQKLADVIAAGMLNSDLVDIDLVMSMPVSFLHTHRGPAADKILAEYFLEHLPGNVRLWEELEKLAPKFPGTVADLVAVARAATGTG